MRTRLDTTLLETFGDPIGTYAGEPAVGVRDQRGGMEEASVCPDCGMMPVDGQCGCSAEGDVCPSCGMMAVGGSCGCGGGVETACQECGMNELECECGYNQSLDEVAPPGYEDIVKGLKKEPTVDNPWAVAWSMKNKGIKPKKTSKK